MKILYFDSVGGASGDMIMAALLDLGADFAEIKRCLESLHIGSFTIAAEKCTEYGIAGMRFHVEIGAHAAGSVCHEEEHVHGRNLEDIRHIIERSALPGRAAETALKVFQRLAEAEAAVHRTSIDKIHFHEVGAVDSIVDIVGACLALEQFAPEAVCVSALPLGRALVTCAHGTLPEPVPATLKLLEGMNVTHTDEPFELVTPTGAALLSTWRTAERLPAVCRILGTGYGWGSRILKARPNLLRAVLLESGASAAGSECLTLECNIDDTTPELMGSLFSQLLEAGALDVYFTPAQMKKQRPGILLCVLCEPWRRDAMLDLIFRESTTLGVRINRTERVTLERRMESVDTAYGPVRVKIGAWQGRDITCAPEHDDCVRAANASGASVREVYEAALSAALPLLQRPSSSGRQ